MQGKQLRSILREEITEQLIYQRLSQVTQDPHNKKILLQLATTEKKHVTLLKKKISDAPAYKLTVFWYVWISRIFGLTFGLNLLRKRVHRSKSKYQTLPKALQKMACLNTNDEKTLNKISEERVNYASSIVLGLSDALVELTGALTGLAFALQQTKLIAAIGFITGCAASLSMAASEYLASKEEDDTEKKPLRAALYTGITYFVTVLLLIFPFLVLEEKLLALGFTLLTGLGLIYFYAFYMSAAKGRNVWDRFGEMALILFTVALISFGIGLAVRFVFGVDV